MLDTAEDLGVLRRVSISFHLISYTGGEGDEVSYILTADGGEFVWFKEPFPTREEQTSGPKFLWLYPFAAQLLPEKLS